MNSLPSRLVLCFFACCVVALGASTASASAATTMNLTFPASPRVNQNMTITTSGSTDQNGAQLQVYVELNGTACNGTNGGSLGNQTVDTAGSYSKDWTFKPTAIGSYHICGYLRYPPDPTPQIAQADVQVHDQLSVFTQPASSVAGHAATFSGGVNEESEPSQSHFEYGTTTSYGNVTPTQTVPAHSNGNGGNGFVTDNVVSLQPATTYHYRLVATDSGGTVNGSDMAFTTEAASSMTMTVPASRFADEAWPVTLSGSAGGASYYAIYAETNGSSCAASDASEGSRPGVALWKSGNVAAGQYSVELPEAVLAQPTPGFYLVCAYLDSSNRLRGPSEASASAPVTVSYRACPSLDFSVTGAAEQTGDRPVFDAVLPADVGGEGTLVHIESSDGGRTVFDGDYKPAGDNFITHGGPQRVSTLLNKKKSVLPSYDGPVTVRFTITYMVTTPYAHCTLPDGTVRDGGDAQRADDGYPVIRSAPQTITVTFRNHGTPPGGAITPGVATDIENAVADALTPTGSAAKIGAILTNGYRAPFVAKAAGQVTGAWYFVPKGAHVAGKPKPVLVASGKTTVKKPGSATLTLRVSKKGKALLKKAKKIKLTTKGTFTSTTGKKLVVTRTIKLKR
jgi:hypothetical protein